MKDFYFSKSSVQITGIYKCLELFVVFGSFKDIFKEIQYELIFKVADSAEPSDRIIIGVQVRFAISEFFAVVIFVVDVRDVTGEFQVFKEQSFVKFSQ